MESWVAKFRIKMNKEYHIPVLLEESIEGLNIKENGVYVDVTYGAGGHSKAILQRLGAKGRLIAFDQDENALANAIDDPRFKLIRSNFKWFGNFLKLEKVGKIDGLLADLGVSSHQFDVADRGFSHRYDGPLDMRMNNQMGVDAAKILSTYDFRQLVTMFSEYGEIRNSKTLANKIIDHRSENLHTTEGLKVLVDQVYVGSRQKYLSQVFQAIRIEVNQEMHVLKRLLRQIPDLMEEGGRLVVISYHSGEDRVVKSFIKNGGLKNDEDNWFNSEEKKWKAVNKKIIVPDESEIHRNSRAKSAKLRIAERI